MEDDEWGRDDWDWDDWPDDEGEEVGSLQLEPPRYEPVSSNVLHAVFEDGPRIRPTLTIADWSTWPDSYVWIARNLAGHVAEFRYQHQGNGHYRVAHEQVLAP